MKLVDLIVKTLEDKKANDVVTIDFNEENPMYGYFVVADAPSFRQVKAMAEEVEFVLEQNGFAIKHMDASKDSPWVLIDAYDVIVHIFLTEERSRYNLEKLYANYINA